MISKKPHETNELLLQLHNFNQNRNNGVEENKFYIFWLMNWFTDNVIRKQKVGLHQREKVDFPKEIFKIFVQIQT